MKTRSSLGFALLFLIPGCSGSGAGLADPTQPPPALAHINGSIKPLPQAVTSGSLRIELAWFVAGGASNQPRIIAQDIPVTAELPANFTLPLSGPPPAGTLWTAGNYPTTDGGTLGWTIWQTVAPTADQSFAVAQLVAYEDFNGNGKLDMVGADATSAPDRIVEGFPGFVLYATGGYGSDVFLPSGTTKDGYGLLVPSVTDTNAAYNQWSPISSPVALFPTPAEWNLLMCTNFSPLVEPNVYEVDLLPGAADPLLAGPLGTMSLFSAPIATSDVVFPAANQPLLQCTPGGTQYCIRACPAPQNQFYVCQTDDTEADPTDPSSTYCKGRFAVNPVCYTMPDAEPAGWPCTYTPGVDCTPDPQYNRCAGGNAGDDGGTATPPHVGDDGGTATPPHVGDDGGTATPPHVGDDGGTATPPHVGVDSGTGG